jgi:hypothetical protein
VLEVPVPITLALLLLANGLAAPTGPSDPPAQAADRPEPFTVGILRRDGVVTPFATFDGKGWDSPWPASLSFIGLPISLDAVPRGWWGKAGPLQQMTVWAGGANRGQVRVESLAPLEIMCSPRLGLRSTYASALPVPPPMEHSYPKDGLVVSGPTPVEELSPVPPTSPEWTASALLLADPFDKAEARAAKAFTQWKHPVPRSERRKMPVVLEALYKAPMDAPGWLAYRFQAVKRYAPRPGEGDCELVSSASGWIAVGPDDKHWTQLNARVTYCDRMDDIFTLPLGLIRAGGRSYWIYQLSGYDREGYAVTRPTPKRIETDVQYAAGSCPR